MVLALLQRAVSKLSGSVRGNKALDTLHQTHCIIQAFCGYDTRHGQPYRSIVPLYQLYSSTDTSESTMGRGRVRIPCGNYIMAIL